MSSPKEAPYGTWRSPISAASVTADTIGFEQIMTDGDDVYWLEVRPSEGGRRVIVLRTSEGQVRDLTRFNLLTLPSAATFNCDLLPRPIDQDLSHGFGSCPEKVPPAVPMLRLLDIHKTDVGVVD